MAQSHVETFTYNNWNISRETHSDHMDVYSSGTATKTSDLFPISKVLGTITASVTGGYGWVSCYKNYNNDEHGVDLYCNLAVNIYLVTSGNVRQSIASATGSARKGGYLNLYNSATSQSCSFNVANLTAEQKASYEYFQIEYRCTTSSSHQSCSKVGAFANGGDGDPSGTASITIRDSINTFLDETEMDGLFYDGREIGSMQFDGVTIF